MDRGGREGQRRLDRILRGLDAAYPGAGCTLRHGSALELLVATILSAQCTDERVNRVTEELFRKYRTPEDYVRVPAEELETDIRSTGFYRNKARNLRGACRKMLESFGGSVPGTMERLLELPGVARKTANVVLGVAFGKAEGVVVDTHVSRVARRLGLSAARTAEGIERDLMAALPRERWISFSHQVILHGRELCRARRPLCGRCPLEPDCPSEEKTVG
jgi:endonuclease-3